jgi:hypothetical protein
MPSNRRQITTPAPSTVKPMTTGSLAARAIISTAPSYTPRRHAVQWASRSGGDGADHGYWHVPPGPDPWTAHEQHAEKWMTSMPAGSHSGKSGQHSSWQSQTGAPDPMRIRHEQQQLEFVETVPSGTHPVKLGVQSVEHIPSHGVTLAIP